MPQEGSAVVASATTGAGDSAVVAEAPAVKYLKDYKPPDFFLDDVRLVFDLDDDGLDTIVHSRLTVRPACVPGTDLVLDGEMLELLPESLKVNDASVPVSQYRVDATKGTLTIDAVALPQSDTFVLESAVRIKPAKNTALEGLYMSSGNYCTQCEGMFSPIYGACKYRQSLFFPSLFLAADVD